MMAHIIFDVKLDCGFVRKIRFVVYGHKVYTPPFMTYAPVVSRDNFWVVLMMVSLNGHDVKCSDTKNIYLHENQKETV